MESSSSSSEVKVVDMLVVLSVVLVFLSLSFFMVFRYFIPAEKKEDCSNDIMYLSSIINAEADPYDTTDMYLIGSTVLNRMDNNNFPGDLDSVVTQRGQYHGYKTKSFVRTKLTDSIAARLLRCENRNFDVLYFYNPRTATHNSFVYKLKSNHSFITSTTAHEYFR